MDSLTCPRCLSERVAVTQLEVNPVIGEVGYRAFQACCRLCAHSWIIEEDDEDDAEGDYSLQQMQG